MRSNILPTPFLLITSVYALLIGGLYYSSLNWLITREWIRNDYTFAYLIPFVFLYLLWEKRIELMAPSSMPSWKGLVPLIIGLALFWMGELGGNLYATYISLWLVLVALFWIHLGWHKLKTMAFALILILVVFPVPPYLYNRISVRLQLISSQMSATMIRLYGIPVFRDGNIIDLGSTQLQVVGACSGLRYLLPLIVLGLLLAYFFKTALWKRILVVVTVVPLAIFTNSLRIALTGILYQHYGEQVAETFFHGFSGWFIFMSALVVLLAEIVALKRIRPSRMGISNPGKAFLELPESKLQSTPNPGARGGIVDKGQPRLAGAVPKERDEGQVDHLSQRKGRNRAVLFLRPKPIVATVLLALTLFFSRGVEFRVNIPIKKPLSLFPLRFSGWQGIRGTMEQEFIDSLRLDGYALIEYADDYGKSVNLYVAYYESQLKGPQHTHNPITCLIGSGWMVKDQGFATVPTPGNLGDSIKVSRAFMKKGDSTQLCYYWFPQRGRNITNVYQLKLLTFLDALIKRRTDGALVRLITPVHKEEEVDESEVRLRNFTKLIVPLLDEYIPGKDLK